MVTTPLWFAPYIAGATLLAAGGAAKAIRPDGTARALRQLRLPVSPLLVRVGGALEMTVGGAAVILGGPVPAVAAAASYIIFAAVVIVASSRAAPLSSCGCFGETDAPPTPAHAVVNIGFAATAAAVLAGHLPSLTSVVAARPTQGMVVVLVAAIAAYLGYLVMAVWPQTAALAKRGAP